MVLDCMRMLLTVSDSNSSGSAASTNSWVGIIANADSAEGLLLVRLNGLSAVSGFCLADESSSKAATMVLFTRKSGSCSCVGSSWTTVMVSGLKYAHCTSAGLPIA